MLMQMRMIINNNRASFGIGLSKAWHSALLWAYMANSLQEGNTVGQRSHSGGFPVQKCQKFSEVLA